MRSKLTDEGVNLPKQWFHGATEVDIQRENDRVIVVPVSSDDPITRLGAKPINIEVDDASEKHDRYLYGQ